MKVAILIDGGFLLKRIGAVRRDVDLKDPESVDRAIGQLVRSHLEHLNKIDGAQNAQSLLYRCFYYDAKPYLNKAQYPISKRSLDYAKSETAKFRLQLFDRLRRRPNFAVRLGEVRLERSWILTEAAQKALIRQELEVPDLKDEHFVAGFKQKAVDMRIGIDIASLSLKKQVDTVVLVAGDADFVPAAKLARREGVRVILDPLWLSVAPDLFEHIDGLRSGYAKPKTSIGPSAAAAEDDEPMQGGA